jgi:hypothetical protein
MMTLRFFIFAALWALSAASLAGPYAPAAGQTGSTAIAKNSTLIKGWATGFSHYTPGTNVDAAWRDPSEALGAAEGTSFDIVALGDAGRITLTFSGSIFNGPGWDFAIFENSFSDTFLEFAFVEVSSNGRTFFRFPSFSLTPNAVGAFGAIDPSNVDGLAGKYRQGFGTPFDLDLFRGVRGLDVNRITQVRLVDVVGNGSEQDNWPVSLGGPHNIYDPYRTSGSGGFDLDALGVRYLNAPPPGSGGTILPNPTPRADGPSPVRRQVTLGHASLRFAAAPAPVPLPPSASLLLLPLATLVRRVRCGTTLYKPKPRV